MNTKPKPFDTVSSATLRDIDLLDAMVETLEYYRPKKYANLIKKCNEIRPLLERDMWYPKSKRWQNFMDTVSWLINEDLFNAMQDIAPSGTYYGSHPGDGALFGFWPYEDSPLWE